MSTRYQNFWTRERIGTKRKWSPVKQKTAVASSPMITSLTRRSFRATDCEFSTHLFISVTQEADESTGGTISWNVRLHWISEETKQHAMNWDMDVHR